MGKLVGLVGAGIGLVKEIQASRHAQAQSQAGPQAQAPRSQQSSGSVQIGTPMDAPPPYSPEPNSRTSSHDYHHNDEKSSYHGDEKSSYHGDEKSSYHDDEKSSDLDTEDDEEAWDLDDAQGEVFTPDESIGKGEDSQVAVTRIVREFVREHPVPMGRTTGRLPYPVILPQRRPENKERGFIRAYAPDLLECGIDQDTFLDFIKAMNKASKASPIFDVIGVGAGLAGLAPSFIAGVVSTAVQVTNRIARNAAVKRQTNGFIEELNEKLFKPRGLFCLMMTFNPGQKTESKPMDISSHVLKSATRNTSRLGNFRNSAGQTNGEIELPVAAPLIFPALDQAADAGPPVGGFKGFTKTVGDYMDRRAQAKYAQNNPDSGLSVGSNPRFASRFGDPNHAANNGGLLGLATGGLVHRREGRGERRSRRAERKALERGCTPEEAKNRAQRKVSRRERGGGPIRGGIKRIMKQDVLYLMIVNMPTEAEMAAYRNGDDSPLSSSSAGPSQQYEVSPNQGQGYFLQGNQGQNQYPPGYQQSGYTQGPSQGPDQQNQGYQNPTYRY